MGKQSSNDLPITTVECRCGGVGFGGKKYLEEQGWNVERGICRNCLENSKRLLILSCSARKADGKGLPALDRYNSPAFFLLRRFLRTNPKPAARLVVWIVSAKYGLISADQRIKTYDQAMTPQRLQDLKRNFRSQFSSIYKSSFGKFEPLEVFCHLPQNYRDAIQTQIDVLGRLAPLKIAAGRPGEKLRELKNWLEEKQEEYANGSHL